MTTRANVGRTPLDRLAAATLAGVVLVAGNGAVAFGTGSDIVTRSDRCAVAEVQR